MQHQIVRAYERTTERTVKSGKLQCTCSQIFDKDHLHAHMRTCIDGKEQQNIKLTLHSTQNVGKSASERVEQRKK